MIKKNTLLATSLLSLLVSCAVIENKNNKGNYMGTDGLYVHFSTFYEQFGYELVSSLDIKADAPLPTVMRSKQEDFYTYIFENYEHIPDETTFIGSPDNHMYFAATGCQREELEEYIAKRFTNIDYITIHKEVFRNACEDVQKSISARMNLFLEVNAREAPSILDVHIFEDAILKYTPHAPSFYHHANKDRKDHATKINYTTIMIKDFIHSSNTTKSTIASYPLFALRSEPLYLKK